MTRIHFIAIGGAVMHNLAIALFNKGYQISGSDDEIFDPARSRLSDLGLLPSSNGWFPEKITSDIDTIILGMHAREDNPELKRARELGLQIKSFPEYLYEQTRDKRRIVIGGSHGKTTITSMVMHVFRYWDIRFDYMVGSMVDGFDTMVGLSDSSKIAVFEGDEYLTSPIDRRPKFHLYHPDIAVINGIAWDHVNVFPDREQYIDQFRIFADKITTGGHLLFFADDSEVSAIASNARPDIQKRGYRVHGYFQNAKGFFAATESRVVKVRVFGEHNMQNMSAAKEVCLLAGITQDQFYEAIAEFRGSSKRLQLLKEENNRAVYSDFAHAPSKVKASVEAICERYPSHRVIACFELHTYSSLNADFLKQYEGTMLPASNSVVYFNPHALELKRLPVISKEDVKGAFGDPGIEVFDDSVELCNWLKKEKSQKVVFLLMSSGDFNGTDIGQLAEELVQGGVGF